MLLAVSANNVAIMWIALEATTIFSALLIPHTRSKSSVEASWKYILIGSVGIALAFAGTVLGYFDFVTLSGRAEHALNWPVLLANAPALHPEVMKLAFVFLLVGYGTKAGIAPMHTWKPDAYGEAPAPLAALMSSALFAVAIYAILRWKVVVDAAIKDHYADNLLLTLGLVSLAIAAFSVAQSRNYKRMLAYSSVEHTGLICLGLGLGAAGVFAALLHLVNHTAAKSLMFFLAGDIERKYGSSAIKQARGLLKVAPWTGGLFAAGLLALVGLPPFGLFISEFALFRAGFSQHHPWLMGAALLLLLVAFVSFITHLNRMLYGEAPAEVAVGETAGWRVAPMLLGLLVLVALGLTLPAPLETLLKQIVRIVSR
jgi:hydrogenase-4 component F